MSEIYTKEDLKQSVIDGSSNAQLEYIPSLGWGRK